MPPRLDGRTGTVWRAYIAGTTQEAIAAEHGVSQQRVSQILAEVRDSIPEVDRGHLVQRETEFLDDLRCRALALVDQGPIPAYSNGKPIYMQDGVTVAEDHSGRLAALDRAVKLHERLSKLLGLDSPAKTDVSLIIQERDATSEAAAAALAYLQAEPGAGQLAVEF